MAAAFSAIAILLAAVVGVTAEVSSPHEYWKSALPNTPIPTTLLQRLQKEKETVLEEKESGFFRKILPLLSSKAASETQPDDNTGSALFFLEKDLVPGKKFEFHFTKTTSDIAFLPRSKANTIPFVSTKLSDILSHLSLEPSSKEAGIIMKTLHTCEKPPVEGEAIYCATSLESMVDFSMASLGSRYLHALSTEVNKPNSPKQTYIVASSGPKKLPGSKVVACHAKSYPYALYYCHATRGIKSYLVSLEGDDRTKVEAVVVCHTDTSSWDSNHIAFQLLKVSPGAVPVCRFLPSDRVLWTRYL